MRKVLGVLLVGMIIVALAACNTGDKKENHEGHDEHDGHDELSFLEVEFEVPETAGVGDTVELKAIVSYEDEPVKDADEVQFEIWIIDEDKDEEENRENSEQIDATNHDDGTYTINYTFEETGEYEMYAHTTARDMHTMPKKKITINE